MFLELMFWVWHQGPKDFFFFVPILFIECLSFLHCSYVKCLNMHMFVSVLILFYWSTGLQLFYKDLSRDLLALFQDIPFAAIVNGITFLSCIS